jgi:hypothetical protein
MVDKLKIGGNTQQVISWRNWQTRRAMGRRVDHPVTCLAHVDEHDGTRLVGSNPTEIAQRRTIEMKPNEEHRDSYIPLPWECPIRPTWSEEAARLAAFERYLIWPLALAERQWGDIGVNPNAVFKNAH